MKLNLLSNESVDEQRQLKWKCTWPHIFWILFTENDDIYKFRILSVEKKRVKHLNIRYEQTFPRFYNSDTILHKVNVA